MTDQQIIDSCRKHGAKVASDAAYAAMEGRRAALIALGLGELQGLADLHRVTTLAYALMSDDDQAADLTKAVIDASKLPTGPRDD